MKDREDEKMNKENNGRKFKLAAVAAMTLAAAAVSHDACAADVGAGWKVGAARVNITPQKPVWMAGYGSRDHESEGVWQDVWAKALALEDKEGRVGVIVTIDICAIARGLSNEIRDRLEREFGLKRDQIIINTSHTHSGPQTVGVLDHIFTNLTEANVARINEYTGRFKDELVALVGRALASRRPSKVLTGQGIVRFAVNRRHNKEGMLTSTSEIKGPSDHAVPVLKVVDESGKTFAILFGYACHNTAIDKYLICGDYAGYAQSEVERMHPGATAMFFQGCGSDQNPLPRRKCPNFSKVIQYGRELAAAVDQVLSEEMVEREPTLVTRYEEIELALQKPVSREELEKIAVAGNGDSGRRYIQEWAKMMLKQLDETHRFAETYSYPVEYWQIGSLKLFALGGEVMSGYSVELKKRYGDDTVVMGYSNDVMSYIPTPEAWDEGGYEVTIAHMVFGLPAPWTRDVTDRILNAAYRLAAER